MCGSILLHENSTKKMWLCFCLGLEPSIPSPPQKKNGTVSPWIKVYSILLDYAVIIFYFKSKISAFSREKAETAKEVLIID